MKHALAISAMLLAGPAQAHDTWANGEPVPAWVKQFCCSQAHAHHLLDTAVHEMSDGIHVDGYEYVIPYKDVLPSPDGTTWLFYATYMDGTHSRPFCFFRGVKGS